MNNTGNTGNTGTGYIARQSSIGLPYSNRMSDIQSLLSDMESSIQFPMIYLFDDSNPSDTDIEMTDSEFLQLERISKLKEMFSTVSLNDKQGKQKIIDSKLPIEVSRKSLACDNDILDFDKTLDLLEAQVVDMELLTEWVDCS